MATLALKVADRALPGAVPVCDHSAFSCVAGAARAEAVVTFAATYGDERPVRVALDGSWKRLVAAEGEAPDSLPDGGAPGWHPVRVPNNYGLEPRLSAHFGPVFYRRRLPEVETDRVRLSFESVDYLCNVWLDDRHLGRHEGYFAPFGFDVTGALRNGSVLTVGVQDPFEDLDPAEPFLRHAKRAIKGTMKYHDSRPGGLPGRHTPGWTPRRGQSLTTGGITGSVELVGTGPVALEASFVTPLDHEEGLVHVALVLTSTIDGAASEATVRVRSTGGEPLEAGLRMLLPEGASRVDFEMRVPDPVPWWPVSHALLGEPATYELEVVLSLGGLVSDVGRTRFGIRTAEVSGEPKRFSLNGRPVYVKAVNYIPRQHFADVDIEFYRRDMDLCAQAHLNSVGIHGHVQCADCYDAADEAGILIFQDFALQWHYDSGEDTNPGFVELACNQIAEMAYALYNHPSVVYWACHNEPTALFVPGMKADPARDFDNQVLDGALESRLREVDPVRHVHRASGIGDDYHLYDGSLNGGELYGVRDREAWFVSEYGFWTLGPRSDRWGDARWPPDGDQLREWLSRLSFGPWTMSFTGLPERYPSLDAWRRATEEYGAYLAKYQTEWIRAHRGKPFNAYRWHFFCDWWGWAGGGLVDVDREPKATYRALAAASRPVLVCTSLPRTVYEPAASLVFEVWAVNDGLDDVDLDVVWSWHVVDESLVIGVDDEVGKRFELHTAGKPGSMVAMPAGGALPPPADVSTMRQSGRIEARAAAESSSLIGRIELEAPMQPLAGGTLELRWGCGERGWFHVLAAERGWFVGPGAWVAGPGGLRRLE